MSLYVLIFIEELPGVVIVSCHGMIAPGFVDAILQLSHHAAVVSQFSYCHKPFGLSITPFPQKLPDPGTVAVHPHGPHPHGPHPPHPHSIVQDALHPSPFVVFPSSHCSPAFIAPSQQMGPHPHEIV